MHADRHEPADPLNARRADDAPEIGSGASATDQGKAKYAAMDRGLGADERDAVSAASTTGGTAGGAIAGATAGSVVAFPFGTAVGAIAGAVGGWWAGHRSAHDVPYTEADDATYRRHWESSPDRLADRGYDAARPAYQLGHLARHNPDYRGRDFAAIEGDLRHGWTDEHHRRYGDWEQVRGFASEAYLRGAPTGPERHGDNPDVAVTPGTWNPALAGQPAGQIDPAVGLTQGGTASHQRATYNDPARGYPDPVVGTSGAAAGAPNETADSSPPGWLATPGEERGTEDSDAARRRARGERE